MILKMEAEEGRHSNLDPFFDLNITTGSSTTNIGRDGNQQHTFDSMPRRNSVGSNPNIMNFEPDRACFELLRT